MGKVYVAEANNYDAGVLTKGEEILRRIGFSIVDGLSQDLLYEAIKYYIDDVSTKNQTIKGFLIKNRVLLEAIIKCKEFAKPGKYDGGLTQGDVVYISDTLIKHDNWIKDHSQLFGFVKDKKSGLYLQTGSNAILDPNLFTGLNEIYSSTRNMEPKTGIEFGTPYQKRK